MANITQRMHEVTSAWNDQIFISEGSTTWVIFEVACLILGVVETYLFACVILFVRRRLQLEPRTRKIPVKRNQIATVESRLQKDVQANTIPNTTKKSITFKRFWNNPGKWLHIWLVGSFVFAYLRFLTGQAIVVISDWSDLACDTLSKAIIVWTGSAMKTVNAFLWCRQNSLYSTPQTAAFRPTWLNYLSKIWLVYNVLTYPTGIGIHIWWREYTVQRHGCAPSVTSYKTESFVPYVVVSSFTVVSQILLTFLFVYPLLFRRSGGKRKNNNSQQNMSVFLDTANRALISCIICVTTDIFAAIVGTYQPKDLHVAKRCTLYHLNICLNATSLLYTYPDWRKIVFPWKAQQQPPDENIEETAK